MVPPGSKLGPLPSAGRSRSDSEAGFRFPLVGDTGFCTAPRIPWNPPLKHCVFLAESLLASVPPVDEETTEVEE